MHIDKGSGTTLDRASRSLPAFIAGGLLGGLLVGVLAGRRAIPQAPDTNAGP